MPKILAISGMVVATLIILLFGLDAASSLFGRPSMVMDILFLISAGLLGYMSWSAYRELA
jgi:threonine/homoserine/homoserine lactone efflux protein